MAPDGVDRIVFSRKISNEIVIEFEIYVPKIVSFAFGFAELIELDDETFIVLDRRCSVTEFMNIEPCAVFHFARIAGDIVGQRFPAACVATAGHAARMMETVNNLFQLRFRHCMFGVFRHFAEDETA